MNEAKKLLNIFKENPNAYTYCYDDGAFSVYKSKEAIEELWSKEYNESYEKECQSITLYEGTDANIWLKMVSELLSLEIEKA
jgi:hypothetical protein